MTTGRWSNLRRVTARVILAVAVAGLLVPTGTPMLDRQAVAQTEGRVPGDTLGNLSDSDLWRAMRQGVAGTVSIPDKKAGILIQSEGDNWRAIRNGPLSIYGGWLLLAVIVVLAVFFAIRGRIRVEVGASGRVIERFNFIERFTHWLTASSFIVLALTGLNMLYGRYVFGIGAGAAPGEFTVWHEVGAAITYYGKLAHNFIAFAFMIGVILMFVLWVRHNVVNRYDLIWLVKGGGLFMKGVHPPARKFNAGQKIVFWIVILAGISISVSGISLMFPFQIPLFAKTFEVVNWFGAELPTDLSVIAEMQLSQLWHAILGLIFIAVIIPHIYIGSLGMEGAFDAMGTGMVDLNWAREHHSIWVAEIKGEPVAAAEHGDD